MRIVSAWLVLLGSAMLLASSAQAQEKPEAPYSLQIVRVSSSPLKLSIDASQAPAGEVLRALAKESGQDILVSESLSVPVTAHLVEQTPEAILLHVGQMKGVRLQAVRVPSSLDTKRLGAEKLGSLIDTMRELGFASAAVPPLPKQGPDTPKAPIAPPVTLIADAASAAQLSQTAGECKTIWLALPEASAEQKPRSETLGELARLNQRAAELMLKLTPEEHKAYQQMQVEYFRQMPLQLQQRTLMDGMALMLGLTPKEQGSLMAGVFRQMSPEQKKAFLNLGTAFMQNVTPEEIP